MNRRGFIGAILATATAPAIVRADSLMRIVPRDAVVFTRALTGELGIVSSMQSTQAVWNLQTTRLVESLHVLASGEAYAMTNDGLLLIRNDGSVKRLAGSLEPNRQLWWDDRAKNYDDIKVLS